MIDCIYKKILFVLASFKPNFDLLRESGECFRGVANLPIGKAPAFQVSCSQIVQYQLALLSSQWQEVGLLGALGELVHRAAQAPGLAVVDR